MSLFKNWWNSEVLVDEQPTVEEVFISVWEEANRLNRGRKWVAAQLGISYEQLLAILGRVRLHYDLPSLRKGGGLEAGKTNKLKYGNDYYPTIGKKGGTISRGGGFARNPEFAREAGRIGGSKSRKGKTIW